MPTHSDIKLLLFERDAVRASYDEISKKPIEHVLLPVLKDIISRLEKLDTAIINKYKKEPPDSDEELRSEFLEAAKLRLEYQELLCRVQALHGNDDSVSDVQSQRGDTDDLQHPNAGNAQLPDNALLLNTSQLRLQGTSAFAQSHMRFPELQLATFDGQIQNWIHWWGKFQKVHEDQGIPAQDKFEYLLQATTGRVLDLVKKYPVSEANYDKVMKLLIQRYGDEKTLTSYYIRQLSGIIKNDYSDLSYLYEELRSNICNLESLGLSSDKIAIIVPLIESSLPLDILTAWEELQAGSGLVLGSQSNLQPVDELEQLMEFLRRKVESQEKAKLKQQTVAMNLPYGSDQGTVTQNFPTAATLVNARPRTRPRGSPSTPVNTANNVTSQPHPPRTRKAQCIFCDGVHFSADCRKAQHMSLAEKEQILTTKEACFQCLGPGHFRPDCRVIVSCVLCHSPRHYVLMCPDVDQRRQTELRQQEQSGPSGRARDSDPPASNSLTPTCVANSVLAPLLSTVFMKILYCYIVLADGSLRKARCMFDSASLYSYIRAQLAADLLLLPQGHRLINHSLFGGSLHRVRHTVYSVTLASIDSATETYTFNFFSQSTICSPVLNYVPPSIEGKLKAMDIHLTDDGTGADDIDSLIGADLEGWLLTTDVCQVTEGVKAIRTQLGWILTGSMPATNRSYDASYTCLNAVPYLPGRPDELPTTPSLMNHSVEEFWDLEQFGVHDHLGTQDPHLQEFQSQVKVNSVGRYEVPLPWVADLANLGPNYYQAYQRLLSLTKTLNRKQRFDEYNAVLQQWEAEGIIELVQDKTVNGHFLCHHPVFKEQSTTTKVRPVFDGSAKSETGFSLNDHLAKGPNMILQLPSLFNGFRAEQIGVVSDIKQAFIQISIDPADRSYLKFLWWDSARQKIQIYQHCRVVFGLKPSPFILAATLKTHLQQHELHETAAKMLKSFYVDNLVTSLPNSTVLDQFMLEADQIMQEGQFLLREWQHSAKDGPHSPSITNPPFDCCDSTPTVVPVLGLQWDIDKDELFCSTHKFEPIEGIVTKRVLLSVLMTIFDPIGFTAPIVILPKILLQKVWELKLSWDDPLPSDIEQPFLNWYHELKALESCKLTRFLFQPGWSSENTTIHVFCDGSIAAYAGCIFARTQIGDQVTVNLVTAKSRVAPKRNTITIPRIELLGAQVAARLWSVVALDFSNVPTHFWTDSTVVLSWLKHAHVWKPFVANRVRDILERTELQQWHHVPGKQNPADLLSRGCNPSTLLENHWWSGPDWLYQDQPLWPSMEATTAVDPDALAEVKKSTTLLNVQSVSSRLAKFESYTKNIRVVAWMFRFAHNLRQPAERRTGPLNGNELSLAETYLIKRIQQDSFDCTTLSSNMPKLELVVDSDGIYRVKTKLSLGDDPYSFRYPALLSLITGFCIENTVVLTFKLKAEL